MLAAWFSMQCLLLRTIEIRAKQKREAKQETTASAEVQPLLAFAGAWQHL